MRASTGPHVTLATMQPKALSKVIGLTAPEAFEPLRLVRVYNAAGEMMKTISIST